MSGKIYLRTKDAIAVAGSYDYIPQHSYIVAEFNQKQYILRAGPSKSLPFIEGGNPFIGDLKFVGAEYLLEYLPSNSASSHHDWDFENNHNSFEIFSGSDDQVIEKFNEMRDIATAINQENLDYRWLDQNCNTAISYVLKYSNFDINLNNLFDENNNLINILGHDKVILYNQLNNPSNKLEFYIDYIKKNLVEKITINEEYIIKKENFIRIFTDSNNIATDAYFVDENDNFLNYNQIFYSINNEKGDNLVFIKNDIYLIENNNKILFTDVIKNFENSLKITYNFVNNNIKSILNQFASPENFLQNLNNVYDDFKNNKSINDIVENIAILTSIKAIFANTQNNLLFNDQDYQKILNNDYNLSNEGLLTLNFIKESSLYKISYNSSLSFVSQIILNGKNFDQQDYLKVGIESVSLATSELVIENIFQNFTYSEALSFGSNAGFSRIISTLISDTFADNKMNSHQWQSALTSAGVVACFAGIGSVIASALYAGAFSGNIGAIFGVIIATELIGGKVLEAGEYFDKIDNFRKILNENGLDSNLYALDKSGTLLKSSNYNDNLYGNDGDDNLIGGNGKNSIYGYDGDDYVIAKNENDIIFGGVGYDEIIAGNGDDFVVGGFGDDIIFGGEGDDEIYGSQIEIVNEALNIIYDNKVYSDQINGGNGNDIIYGENGDDIIFGGSGNDKIYANLGNDLIFLNSGSNILYAGDGNDSIYGGDDGDEIYAQNSSDQIYCGNGDDLVYGGSEDDLIDGNQGKDLIFGGFGNDIIFAGEENKFFEKKPFYDIQNSINGEFGDDYLIGSNLNDAISDGYGDDIIYGANGDDIINIGFGDNIIFYDIDNGKDIIDIELIEKNNFENFGENIILINNYGLNENINDIIKIIKNNNAIEINFKSGEANKNKIIIENQFLDTNKFLISKLQFSDKFAIDLKNLEFNENNEALIKFDIFINQNANIKYDYLISFQDQLNISKEIDNFNLFKNNSIANNNYHDSGEIIDIKNELFNDVQWIEIKKQRNIFGGYYNVYKMFYDATIYAENEDSRVVGNYWSEFIFGNQYNNHLSGSSGQDYFDGYEGDDIIYGGSDDDVINGGDGMDLIFGGTGADVINGNLGNDEIYGNDGNDIIDDLSGQNLIFGQNGNDKININDLSNLVYAGNGDDIIRVISQDQQTISNTKNLLNHNIIFGNDGNDNIFGGKKTDYLYGQIGSDYIDGQDGNDYISGGAGNDILRGDNGSDKIFGDIGNDYIYGGNGDDYLWGGYGNDIIYDEEGNDYIKSGFGDDIIYDGFGNDYIYTEDGNDLIYLFSGNNTVNSGTGNDQIFLNDGDNKIYAQDGNDLIFDNFGNDEFYLGEGKDIIFLEYSKNTSSQENFIKDFNKNEDKIIIKTNIKNPITYFQIISNAIEENGNLFIQINDSKLILNNISIFDLTNDNLKIAYTIDENEKILLGEYGKNFLVGNENDNIIYGSVFNDELMGGGGIDSLNGLEGDDILHFELDDKFIKKEQLVFSDEIAHYYYKNPEAKMLIPIIVEHDFIYKPSNSISYNKNINNNEIFIDKYELIMNNKIDQYFIDNNLSKSIDEAYPFEGIRQLVSVEKVDYLYSKISSFATINFYNQQIIDINSYNRCYDNFDGGSGFNIILMTNGNDFLAYSDNNDNSLSRIQSIEAIFAQDGNDIINFSSTQFSMNDLLIRGGLGNDKLIIGNGNDNIFGDDGDDEIYGGDGNDAINGGFGNDIIYSGNGDDCVDAIYGIDEIYLENGNDKILIGNQTKMLDGGEGIDELNLNNINQEIEINLLDNKIYFKNYENPAINIQNIENIISTNYSDEIHGNDKDNQINGALGDDAIYGGNGNDTYLISKDSGSDILIEFENSGMDKIKFLNNINLNDLIFYKNNNNLEIENKNYNQKVIIKDQYIGNTKIEYIEATNLDIFDISNIIINEEDAIIKLDENFINTYLDNKNSYKNLNFIANNGNIFFSEIYGIYIYQPNANFYGFDNIIFKEDNEIIKSISVFNNSQNDNPILNNENVIKEFSYKVNEKISINFNDYYKDPDGDILNFELYLNDFLQLPNWINFDFKSGLLEMELPRSGSMDFKIKIDDKNGGYIYQDFIINISRDIKEDVSNIINKNEIIGDELQNKLFAIINSNDVLIANNGDDEIFYNLDELWQDNSKNNFKAWNIYSGDEFEINNKLKSNDCFDGGDGYDILNLTENDDALFLDDQNLSIFGKTAKFSNIEEIRSFDGDDVIDMTSLDFIYGNINIYGGNGNDILWSSYGNDNLYGEDGNDNIQGGIGNDNLIGGNGNDIIKGFDGNDIIKGGQGSDILESGYGNDIFEYDEISESNEFYQDLILDFNVLFDKISIKNFNFNNIKYKEFIENEQIENQNYNSLFYYHNKNLDTEIYSDNMDFSIILKGELYLNDNNFIYS